MLFISGTAALIVIATRNPADLVSENYYEDEVRFQGHIDTMERTQRLLSPATIAYDAAGRRITISLPQTGAEGRIQLYRPSSSGLDRSVELRPDARGIQDVDASQLEPGLWKVKIAWRANGTDYLAIKSVVVIGARKS